VKISVLCAMHLLYLKFEVQRSLMDVSYRPIQETHAVHDAVVSKLKAASRGSPCDNTASCKSFLENIIVLSTVLAPNV